MNMKNILITSIALLALTLGACGGKNKKQEQTKPGTEQLQTASSVEETADGFAKKIFEALEDDDYDRLETIGHEMGEYIATLDEDQGETFGETFGMSFYQYSDRYGYGQEFATEFLQAMAAAMTEE